MRNAFPAIARGTTEGVDSLSDDKVAAFFRRHPESGDLLIVMNLRADTAVKEMTGAVSAADGVDSAGIDRGLTLAAVLNTGEEDITYEQGVLTLPGYSIAVFTLDNTQ